MRSWFYHIFSLQLFFKSQSRPVTALICCARDWFSAVDSFEVDFQQRYPLTGKAKYLEVDQLPGDLLVIPTGWFHQVRLVTVVQPVQVVLQVRLVAVIQPVQVVLQVRLASPCIIIISTMYVYCR